MNIPESGGSFEDFDGRQWLLTFTAYALSSENSWNKNEINTNVTFVSIAPQARTSAQKVVQNILAESNLFIVHDRLTSKRLKIFSFNFFSFT